ncbi:MAG: biopolymer transporter ExbD [Gammaproteobacteria bacterium]|nr:biopolymer transporter ExbD [Gammaproteobacteria bacterium]MBQ0838211.1 biopolymer transporter ExbD [Gammaproteobacteria bacterium]
MHLQSHHRKALRRISLTPLADLVFILLVFFILETSFVEFREIAFKVPDEPTTASHAAGESLSIQVFPGGKLWIEGESLALTDLTPWLLRKQLGEETAVVLKAQDRVALQTLVETMDLLRAQSLSRVQIHALGDN